ncbi:hypothetical protein M8J77_013822 [Diaphorina citri]|nr:hypothetical protein M8J77_013822 [Diaphorina citri]
MKNLREEQENRVKHGDAAHQHEEDTPRYDAAEEQDGHAAAQEQNGQVVAQEQDGHVAAHEHDGHVAAHEQDGHVATHEQDGHVVAHERDRHVTAYEQEAHVTDSCSTLSNTLAQLQEQLDNIQKQLKGLQKSITPQEIKTASAQIPNVTQGKNINIFIVGDSHVRDLKTIMESKLPKNLSVDHSFIPGGRFHDISSKCIKKYENCDHLIVMAGTNDIGKTSFKEIKTHIENIIIKFKDSKIHLVLVPDRFDKVTMNLDIKILNDKIKTLVKDYKNITIYHTTSIVDSWDYCDNIHFGPNGDSWRTQTPSVNSTSVIPVAPKSLYQYADDTSALVIEDTEIEATRKSNLLLSTMEIWFHDNLLHNNTDKMEIRYMRTNIEKYTLANDIHTYVTRHALTGDIVIPRYRTTKARDSPESVAIRLYNKIPPSIRNLPLRDFLAAMEDFLLKNPIYKYNEFYNLEIPPL